MENLIFARNITEKDMVEKFRRATEASVSRHMKQRCVRGLPYTGNIFVKKISLFAESPANSSRKLKKLLQHAVKMRGLRFADNTIDMVTRENRSGLSLYR